MADYRKKFSKIYDQHIKKIYRFVFLKVNSREIAEDLCSKTFLRGWEAFKKAQTNPNNPKIENIQAFLYKIARNLVTDYYRKKGKYSVISAEYTKILDPRPNMEEKTLFDSDFNAIRHALINLKNDYQDIIIWHYLDDFSIAEIAKMMDKSEGAVRVMLHRALKALRTTINEV